MIRVLLCVLSILQGREKNKKKFNRIETLLKETPGDFDFYKGKGGKQKEKANW